MSFDLDKLFLALRSLNLIAQNSELKIIVISNNNETV